MSRIGNKAITIPAGVEFNVTEANEVTVKGPKGSLTRQFSPLMTIKVEENVIKVERPNDEKHTKQLHGTTRALINNMINGVNEGFTKVLEIVGIGYKAEIVNNQLVLSVGYSHDIKFDIEDGISITCRNPQEITVSGIDKQRVGELAANIRATRKPEPYKGKGIRYKDEIVRHKEGKTAAK